MSFVPITHWPGLVYSASLIYFTSIPSLVQVFHLGMTTASFFISQLPLSFLLDSSFLGLPEKSCKKSMSDHVPALRTLQLLSICFRMCFPRLERLKGPPLSLGPDWLGSLTSYFLPVPNSGYISKMLPFGDINDHLLNMLSHVCDLFVCFLWV